MHTCRLRSKATQCRESSTSARQKTRTNSIKADLYGLFCLFNFCVGLEPFEHRYARRTSSHFCLAAKPLHAVITTAPPSQEQARLFALRQNRSMPYKARHRGSQNSRDTVRRPSFFFPIIYFGFFFLIFGNGSSSYIVLNSRVKNSLLSTSSTSNISFPVS